MQYAVGTMFVIVVIAAFGAVAFVRHESKPEARPSLAAATRTLRRSNRLVVASASGECACGGVLGATGRTSRRYGPLQACSDCGQTWTEDGRRIILRRRPQGAVSRIRPAVRRRRVSQNTDQEQ
jgi:hypothetical protein